MASSKKPQRVSSPDSLVQHLTSFLQQNTTPTRSLVLGLSGGLDSCVLLHLLVQARLQSDFQLSAFHVNHQISPNAEAWQQFCAELCAQYEVSFQAAKVDVPRDSGLGLEAAAREVRYAALLASEGDVVLAHHQDDQVETMLLQLLRGAGVNGLAAMPAIREESKQRIFRPLLDVPRNQLLDYANKHHLKWIEDESNDSLQYDRNFLRHKVLPVLGERFKGYRGTLSRTAYNLSETAALMTQLAREDAEKAIADERLDIAWLKAVTPERAMNLLRWWINELTELNPSSAQLHNILNQLCHAKPNARIICKLGNTVLRRYRQQAYIDKGAEPLFYELEWHGEASLDLPDGRQLLFHEVIGQGIAFAKIQHGLRITSRMDSVSLRLSHKRPKRSLKNLWQEAGIPPWERDRVPFIWHKDKLIAVQGLGIDCEWRTGSKETGLLVECYNPTL